MKNTLLKLKDGYLYPPLILVASLWIIFGFQKTGLFRGCYGVIAWQVRGLKGILLSPLFHANLSHLMSNTLPLLVLSVFLFLFYKKQAYIVLLVGWLASGFLLWLLPDFNAFSSNINSCHIGASGLIYMLASFLFWSGIFSRQALLIIISITIAFLYGGLIYGVFPYLAGTGISWQGHLVGAIVGVCFAYRLNRKPRLGIRI